MYGGLSYTFLKADIPVCSDMVHSSLWFASSVSASRSRIGKVDHIFTFRSARRISQRAGVPACDGIKSSRDSRQT
jgi:hypothetical protein